MVPQGSHLGPILFILFINDIGDKLESKYLLYADDLKIFSKINCVDDMIIFLHDINNLSDWFRINKLNLNKNKCVTLCLFRCTTQYAPEYILDFHKLTVVSSVKDLGVIIDNKLNFTEYIGKTTLKSYKTLGFILRTAVKNSAT